MHFAALAVGLPQYPHEHRPERPILLAVDQEFGEGDQAADTLAPRFFGRMRLASLTRSGQRRVGISFGS